MEDSSAAWTVANTCLDMVLQIKELRTAVKVQEEGAMVVTFPAYKDAERFIKRESASVIVVQHDNARVRRNGGSRHVDTKKRDGAYTFGVSIPHPDNSGTLLIKYRTAIEEALPSNGVTISCEDAIKLLNM